LRQVWKAGAIIARPLRAGARAAAVEHDEILSAAFARLLRWTDPAPLPSLDDVLFEHLFGMLGLGTLRTLEQRQRVSALAPK